MKSLIAAASVMVLGFAAPAFAQGQAGASPGFYATLGYAGMSESGVDLGAIQGRLGYRFNDWFAAEGEVAGGVKDDTVGIAPGLDAKVKLDHKEAIYAAGFVPLAPQWDLIGRVGYGHTKIEASAAGVTATNSGDSWNFGAGAQYRFDDWNGVRADYTREEYQGHDAGHADVWSVAYSRRF